MNCETCREHLVDYLYGELDERRREAVEAALSACPDCRDELASMQAIRDGWQRVADVEPPARMHANILREARLAADARSGRREDAPWWAALFQPAFAMAAIAVVGVGVTVSMLGGDGDDAAPSMEAVANAPTVDGAGSASEATPADASVMAALVEEESEGEPLDLERSPRAGTPGAGDDGAASAVELGANPQTAVDRLDAAPPAPTPAAPARSARGYDGLSVAEAPAGSASGRGSSGSGGIPIREPWQSRTLGGSVLDNEGRTMSNAMRPDPSEDAVAAAPAAVADMAEYAPTPDSGFGGGGSAAGIGTGAAQVAGATGSSVVGGLETGDGDADAVPATTTTSRSAGADRARGALADEAVAAADPQAAWAEDADDGAEAEEGAPLGDGFAGETAREARAELGVAPDDLYARGTSAYDRGDWTAAVDDLASFVAAAAPADARRAEALYHVGAAQVQLGQRAAARATLERFVSLYPTHLWTDAARRLLEDLADPASDTMLRRQNAAPEAEPAAEPSRAAPSAYE